MNKQLFIRKTCLNFMKVFLSLLVFTLLCTGCIKIPDEEIPITLSVSQDSINFTSSGASLTITVNSNDEWSVHSAASWITVSPSYGYYSGTVTVTADRNTSSASRNATVTVRSYVPGLGAQTISVTQSGATPTAQVRFRKDGAYWLYTNMGVENTSGNLVVSYNFGSSSGTSSYYSVPAGTYIPTVYNTDYGSWSYFWFTSDGSLYTVYLSSGNRYTIRLYYNSSGYHLSTDNDGVF